MACKEHLTPVSSPEDSDEILLARRNEILASFKKADAFSPFHSTLLYEAFSLHQPSHLEEFAQFLHDHYSGLIVRLDEIFRAVLKVMNDIPDHRPPSLLFLAWRDRFDWLSSLQKLLKPNVNQPSTEARPSVGLTVVR